MLLCGDGLGELSTYRRLNAVKPPPAEMAFDYLHSSTYGWQQARLTPRRRLLLSVPLTSTQIKIDCRQLQMSIRC